jgi:hypothetical protein
VRIWYAVLFLLFMHAPSFSDERFFPFGSLGFNTEISERTERHYSEHLKSMGEFPLFRAGKDEKIYRFTWLRSFHHAMVFRLVVNPDGSGVLYSKESSGKGGYEPGKILKSTEIIQSVEAVRRIERQMVSFDFWGMQSRSDDDMGLDGADWVFEASSNGIYHFVVRNSPQGTKFSKSMQQLMISSGLELGSIY